MSSKKPPVPAEVAKDDADGRASSGPALHFARGSQRLQRLSDEEQRRAETKAGTPIPVAFYGRLSRNRSGEVTGLDRQAAETVPWAEAKGWKVVVRHSDDDTSAFALRRNRPGFEALLDDLERGEVRGVVVWKLDRLVRRTLDWARVLPKAEETPWWVASYSDGINTSDPMGRLLGGILVQMAELEASNIRTREQSKHSELAQAGRWSGGGSRAFGHSPDRRSVVDDEADAIRKVADGVISGRTLISLANEMAAAGVVGPGAPAKDDRPARAGGKIEASVWRRILTSPRLVGRRAVSNERLSDEVGMAPILETDKWLELQEALNRPSGSEGVGTKRKHLLSGLLACGVCGVPLRSWKNHDRAAYACLSSLGGCDATTILAEPVEAVVTEAALRYLERLDLGAYVERADREAEEIMSSIAREDAKLEDLARERFDTQRITDPEFQAARLPILRRREDLLTRFRNRAGRPPEIGPGSIRAAWAGWGLVERRRALETAVVKVTVARGFGAREPHSDGSFPRGRPTRRLRPSERLQIELRAL